MYEQHSMKDVKTYRSAAMTLKASNMKYGRHQMINNTVCYYQTPCNTALIVKQLSNYDNMLREQIETDEDVVLQLKRKISDKKA